MTYRLLLADDEPLILMGLRKIIQRYMPEIQVVAEAYDGAQAYDLIRQHVPHIVIVDVEMPEMDGLSLMERAASLDHPPHFIVLSGYSEFHYVRRALRAGVADYLLKPVGEMELIHLLEQLIERIQADAQLKNRLQHVDHLVLDNALGALLAGGAGAHPSAETLGIIEQKLAHGPMTAVWFQHDNAGIKPVFFDADAYKRAFLPVLQRQWGQDAFACIQQPEALVLVLRHEKLGMETLRDTLAHLLEVAPSAQVLLVGVGSFKTFLSSLGLCAQQARRALMMRPYEEKETAVQVFWYGDFARTEDQLSLQMSRRRTQLSDTIILSEEENAQALLADLFDQLFSQRVNPYILRDFFIIALEQLSVPEEEGEEIARLTASIRDLARCATRAHYFARLSQTVHEACGIIRRLKQGRVRQLIEYAKRYIDEHCGEKLSLTSVAEQLKLSPAYLSHLFKQETQQNFVTYVTQRRLDMAKRLLVERPDLKIYEVADLVGFGDVKYFNRIFKLDTKLKPGAYREKYIREDIGEKGEGI